MFINDGHTDNHIHVHVANNAPNFVYYSIPNFPKNHFIMLVIVLYVLLIVIIISQVSSVAINNKIYKLAA